VEREKVDRYYAAADLFVFSSITETQGLVVQEAMSHGLPVVAVAGGGAVASIQHGRNGFVCKNEPLSFASAMLRVLSDPELYLRMSDEAHLSVRDLTLPQMANSVLDVYSRTLATNLPSRLNSPYARL
jgi:glycosyltransferase involved in cell wall biosynthesis